ncbi:MAG: HAMP domain-containing protein [Chloroflexi bacterium]|nr:HAMP domain-containing protein [Chloroflexota bacterium]
MRRRLRLRDRLLISHLLVVAVGLATVFGAVGLVAPGAFEAAMGPSMTGMGDMMSGAVRAAFQDAVGTALLVAGLAAVVAAIVLSLAVAVRLSRPIARLADASRRIAEGRYAERMPVSSADEIGELAMSFNQMTDSLESTERRRLELVGDVAHELRTPLATLDGYLEGLQDGVVEAGEPTWQLLRRETARLSRLVDDLQQLWRAEARQLPLSPTRVDIRTMLDAVRERFAASAAEHGDELRVTVPVGELAVEADPDRLAQVVDNLVSNAIRYSPEGAPVALHAVADGDDVVIAVSDQGVGLTAEQQTRVFERFYRVDPSRARALGGSGIGLAIARALTEAMGGRIWAESEGSGKGSTFSIALPRVR